MKKTLLLMAAIVLSTMSASAQKILSLPNASIQKNAAAAPLARTAQVPRKITLADNQVVMGAYDNDTYVTNLDYSSGVPNYASGLVKWANLFPVEDLKPFEGNRIVKMRVAFAVAPGASTFFIAPVTADGIGSNVVELTCENAKAGWNELSLDVPYTIDLTGVEGYLMGCTYNQLRTKSGQYYTDACYPMSVVDEGSKQYPLYVYMNSAWYSLGSGNISVQAIVEGTFPTNAAATSDFGQEVVLLTKTTTINLPLHNLGKAGISSIDYTTSFNGATGVEKHLDLSTPFTQFGGHTTVGVPLLASGKEQTQKCTLTITKVNGQPNEAQSGTTSNGLLATIANAVKRRVTVEEFTGTACGWCPRGMVAMEALRKTFGDKFVGIALHQYNNTDPMYISGYTDLDFAGAPQCTMDRKIYLDPSQASSYFDALYNIPAKAAIGVTARWIDDSNVEAVAHVLPLINGGSYGLEFVLVADSLRGTASAWNQSNYYYQYTTAQGGAEMADFCKGGKYGKSTVSGLYFNDVALASSMDNVAPLLQVEDNTPVEVAYTLSLPTNEALASAIKKEQVSVVALVTDYFDGTIVNAYKLAVPSASSGIDGVSTRTGGQQFSDRYSLDGRRLSAPQKGLNIVRMADGTTRKVMVK